MDLDIRTVTNTAFAAIFPDRIENVPQVYPTINVSKPDRQVAVFLSKSHRYGKELYP
jgi:hypothetical protein